MAIDYSALGPGSIGKGTPRVVDRIARKQAYAKQERECRAAVDLRDGRVCFFPACRKFAREKHHIEARSQGGTWKPENILSACTPHHSWFKAGLIRVAGNPNDGPVAVTLTQLGIDAGLVVPERKAA